MLTKICFTKNLLSKNRKKQHANLEIKNTMSIFNVATLKKQFILKMLNSKDAGRENIFYKLTIQAPVLF